LGVHPDHDFGTLPQGENSDIVHLGYCNIASIPAKVVSNSKVNAIRKYACKNDLDGFLGIEANIKWKGMPPEGHLLSFFSENKSKQYLHTLHFKTLVANSKVAYLVLLSGSWLQRCRTLDKTIWDNGLGCFFRGMLATGSKLFWHISLARQLTLRWVWYISNINVNRPRTAAQSLPMTQIPK
jgi:hypothetical protein